MEDEQDDDDDSEDDVEERLMSPSATWARPVASAAVSMRLPNMTVDKSEVGKSGAWCPKSAAPGALRVELELKGRWSLLAGANACPGFSPDLDAVSYSLSDELRSTQVIV